MTAAGERLGDGRGAPSHAPVIRQLMDPHFLHRQLRMIQSAGAAHPDGNQVAEHHYGAAFAELALARGGPEPGLPFVARASALVALLQTTLTACFETSGAELAHPPGSMAGLAHRILTGVHALGRLCPCDPRWIECELAEALARLEHRPPFPAVPAPPVRLADDARVIVLGDWGSGLPGAIGVARRIAAELGRGRPRQQHVVHLGDVYYSGWPGEYETRFLPHWPVAPDDDRVLSWALNGNHDMFSGGHGYFDRLLRDPRFRGHRLAGDGGGGVSSWFSLENDHWQILGLDTAYLDGRLAGTQAAWVSGRLEAGGRRTMLLSHHQPFSAYEPVGPDLLGALRPAIDQHPVDAWLWGHEHRCVVYADRPVPYLGFGSCVGHGGVPRLMLADPEPSGGPRVTWSSSAADERGGRRWGRFGFAVLDFAGPAVEVRYVDETGALERVERI